jgi:hypothetical protein
VRRGFGEMPRCKILENPKNRTITLPTERWNVSLERRKGERRFDNKVKER